MDISGNEISQTDQLNREIRPQGRILVVDDNTSLCQTLRIIFEKEGYYAQGALTGKETLEAATEKRFDLALLDIRLPDMDGTDLLSELSDINPEMEFILITGYASVETAIRAMEKKASGYLTKPLDIERTLETVSRVIEKKQLIQEKRNAELALLESETKYQSLVENTTVGIQIVQGDPMKIVFANSAMEYITGYSPEELVEFDPTAVFDLIHPDEREKILANYRLRIAGGDALDRYEIKMVHKNGQIRNAMLGTSLYEYDGKPASLVTFEDVTETRKAERELKESELKYRTTLKSIGDPLHLIDREYRIHLLNPAFVAWLEELGLDSDLMNKTVFEAFPFLPLNVKQEYDEVFSTGKMHLSIEEVNLEGKEIIIETRKIAVIQENQVVQILTMIRDITIQRKAEQVIHQSEELFRGVFEQSPVAIELFDNSGKLLRANPATIELFGTKSMEDFAGFNLYEDPNTPEWVKAELRTGNTVRFELEFDFEKARQGSLSETSKSGIIFLDVLHTPLDIVGDGVIDGILTQIQDITTRKLAENSLMESEERLELALKGADLGVWDWAIDIDIHVNERFAELMGCSIDSFHERFHEWKEITHPEDHERVVSDWKKHENGETSTYSSEYRLQTADGSLRWVLDRGKIVEWNDDGTPRRALGTCLDITDQKVAADALEHSEEKYRHLAEESLQGLAIISTDGVIYSNPAYAAFSGRTVEELLKMDLNEVMSIVHPEDRVKLEKKWMNQFKEDRIGEYNQNEYRVIHKDGDSRWIESYSTIVNYEDNLAIQVVGLDVTERKLAQDSLRESEESLELALKGADLGMWDHQITSKTWRVSERFAEITGYSVEDFESGRVKWEDLIHPDDIAPVDEQWQLHESNQNPVFSVEYRLQTKNGNRKWVLDRGKVVQRNDDGSPNRSSGTLLDITDRKIAEQALLESEERYRLMAETIQDGLMILEESPVYANDRICEIFGYPLEEFLTKTTMDFVAPEEKARVEDLIGNSMNDGTFLERLDFWAVRKDGQRRYTSNRFSHTIKTDGQVVRYVVTTDITEQKLAEEALEKQAQTLNERVKELTCLHESTRLIATEPSIDEVFEGILPLMQEAWQYPEITGVKAVYQNKIFATSDFKETQWKLVMNIRVFGEDIGELSVFYLEERPPEDIGPFLKEEQTLLAALSDKLGTYLEGISARDALSESEKRYRYLFENLADGIAIVDLKGTITMSNDKLSSIFGYTLDETNGMTFTHFLHPESKDLVLAQFDEGLKTGSPNPDGLEIAAIRKERSTIDIHVSNTLLYENDQPIGYQSVIRDITNEKEAERLIIEERDRAQGYLDIAGAAIVVLDKEGHVSLINQKGSEILGHSIDEVVGKDWFENFIPQSMRTDVRRLFLGLMKGENGDLRAKENPVLTASGEERIIEWRNSVVTDSEGKPIGTMSSGVDVTDRRKAEAELVAAKEFADTAINSQMDTFFVFDSNTGKAVQWNDTFRMVSEYNDEEIASLPAPVSYYDEDGIAKAAEYVQNILDGGSGTVQIDLITKSGKRIPFEYSASVIEDDNNGSVFIVSVGRDVSYRKKAEEELRTAADTATLYLDIMGHDVRNHLQAIVMGTDIMSHLELGAEVEPIFELIVESVENSQKLIDQVQATRELLSTSLMRVSLSDHFDSCTKKVAELYDDVEFEITSEVNNGEIYADEFLEVLCRNLVDNAVHHNTNKDRNVWITLREMKDSYIVTVQDNGPGITDERKESLFDAERRFGGIGIHQAKKIVEKYGGSISVGDRVDGDSSQGASFVVWLPRAEAAHNGE